MHMHCTCRGVTSHTISTNGEVAYTVICMESNINGTFQKFHAILKHANYLRGEETDPKKFRF